MSDQGQPVMWLLTGWEMSKVHTLREGQHQETLCGRVVPRFTRYTMTNEDLRERRCKSCNR